MPAQTVGEAATIQPQGSASVTVNQSSQNTIINWQTFNIYRGDDLSPERQAARDHPGAGLVDPTKAIQDADAIRPVGQPAKP